jgi:hypothetical protein
MSGFFSRNAIPEIMSTWQTQASNLIKDSAWEASRQQLRLIMGETRKSMTRLTLVRMKPGARIPARSSRVCLGLTREDMRTRLQ